MTTKTHTAAAPANAAPRQVLCFGEALIDFLHSGIQSQGPLQLPAYRQFPGGAPANAAVAVAKLGGNARFAGQVGQDAFGDFLAHALSAYGVDLSLLQRHPTAKTALAFVMLDESGDRSFSFYRDQSADVLFAPAQITADWFAAKPIVHFCSNTLTDDFIANTTQQLVQQAKAAGCLVSFDVNLRHNLWAGAKADRDCVNQLVQQADIVKFSRDELQYLAQGAASEDAYLQQSLQAGCQLLLVTDGAHRIDYYQSSYDDAAQNSTIQNSTMLNSTMQNHTSHKDTIQPPTVQVVDTTAGGDAFMGGLLYSFSCLPTDHQAQHGLIKNGLIKNGLPAGGLLKACIEFATACGAVTVTRPGAFPALPNLSEVLGALAARQVEISPLLPFFPTATIAPTPSSVTTTVF